MHSEFLTYFRLGIGHIADLRGYDHILFIVALTAGYALRDWRRLLWLVTAFTIGHSVTLALATLGLVAVHGPSIELLIPVTIVATAGYSLLARWRPGASTDESPTRASSTPLHTCGVFRTDSRARLLQLPAGYPWGRGEHPAPPVRLQRRPRSRPAGHRRRRAAGRDPRLRRGRTGETPVGDGALDRDRARRPADDCRAAPSRLGRQRARRVED